MKLIIVSGTSGAGKSIALQALEDLGLYCIDNLPIAMLPVFAKQMVNPAQLVYDYAAVGIDARTLGGDLSQIQDMLDAIKEMGIAHEIIFLDANESTLLKRFSETRRRHPLTRTDIPLFEAIRTERKLLSPLSSNAGWHIDTSMTNVHQLRELIVERLKNNKTQALSILFLSFGFKNGLPTDADIVFDVRCLPNPHWDPQLRDQTGCDQDVVYFLESQVLVQNMLDDMNTYLTKWLPHYQAQNRSYMTIAIGCTGGQHRSVYCVEKMAQLFRNNHGDLVVRHRELS
ncbi:RNase adapter protein RapZ [hydrothermal vent metagenome]|uniref:RNase adapter protein RapZ n=1 Tax=hydrothermal vent metagenome TaxID=652676 RepID=A0A3B0ZI77_9ZZZZ